MSGHDDHGHHGPSSFWTKYVFSTDHKVIGLQFMFTGLLFVILGGLLALGVRYQLAWPQQDVPYDWLLPGVPDAETPQAPAMTKAAPEPNLAHWDIGHEVEISKEVRIDGMTVPAGAKATLTDFPRGLAVTAPAGTRVQEPDGSIRTLNKDLSGFVDKIRVMGDYSYKPPARARTVAGTTFRVAGEDGPTNRELTLLGRRIYRPGPAGTTEVDESETTVLLPVDAARTLVRLEVHAAGQEGESEGEGVATPPVEGGEVLVSADQVTYTVQALTTDAYLSLFTMHASIMIFFVIIPVLVGAFGNFCVPLMVGAKDMAFPKLNMLSFWISFPAGLIMLLSFWTMGGSSGGGWTMYPPLSEAKYFTQVGTTLWIFSVALVGFSSIVGALNYITTIINMRAPGMTLFRMPLTVWSILITSALALFATPMLTAAMFMLLLDRIAGTMFFLPDQGGQPLLFQHVFWFYSHPAVYIMILPAMGITSDILATFARKPIFGYKPMIYAMGGITGLGFIVWGHHMFQSGMNPILGTTFMASTIMIAVPSAIKVFNWLGTLWGGNIRFTVPMLNALAFVSMFTIGGLSGIFMASAPVDIQIHDTYFIVAHIHYVLFGGSIFGIFAGVYYWFPKMFGRKMNHKWGVIHFIMTVVAFNGTFFIMHIIGVGGHPRRYFAIHEYPQLEHLQGINVVMTIFAIMLGTAQLPFFYNFFASLPRKLGRAMVAIYTIAFFGPMVMGRTYWGRYPDAVKSAAESMQAAVADGSTTAEVAQATAESSAWASSLVMSLGAGALFAAVVVGAVFLVWEIGGRLQLPSILQRVLYVVFLPAFLLPALYMKQDVYMWLGVPGLYEHRLLIMVLCGVPGLIYLLAARPQDAFGKVAETNPWHANSLEWATSSPPPHLNFETIPVVYHGPYEYSSPDTEEDYLPQVRPLPKGMHDPAAESALG